METKQQKYQREYYEKNKLKKNAYYKSNKDKILNYGKEWFGKNPQYRKDKFDSLPEDKKQDLRDYWNKNKIKDNKRKRDFVNEYKKGKECIKCKENRYYILDFHHIDPKIKKFNLGESSKQSIEKITLEFTKCVLLCRNCHSEFHFLEKINKILLEEYLK